MTIEDTTSNVFFLTFLAVLAKFVYFKAAVEIGGKIQKFLISTSGHWTLLFGYGLLLLHSFVVLFPRLLPISLDRFFAPWLLLLLRAMPAVLSHMS